MLVAPKENQTKQGWLLSVSRPPACFLFGHPLLGVVLREANSESISGGPPALDWGKLCVRQRLEASKGQGAGPSCHFDMRGVVKNKGLVQTKGNGPSQEQH